MNYFALNDSDTSNGDRSSFAIEVPGTIGWQCYIYKSGAAAEFSLLPFLPTCTYRIFGPQVRFKRWRRTSRYSDFVYARKYGVSPDPLHRRDSIDEAAQPQSQSLLGSHIQEP